MQKRHRVFIAINLPEDIKRALEKRQKSIQSMFADLGNGQFGEIMKWTGKDNLHITLEFLGDLTDVEIADVCKIAGEVAKRHRSFSINLNKICYDSAASLARHRAFCGELSSPQKAGRVPKMIWTVGERVYELAELKEDLQELLVEKVSYRPEHKGFVPHITLARIKEWEFKKIEPDERSEVNEDIDLVFTVESIEVMESQLKRGGPVYTILESCELKA